jgi:NAD-dependent DNA ligase
MVKALKDFSVATTLTFLLKDARYATIANLLSGRAMLSFVQEFVHKDEDSITNEELDTAEAVIKVSKALYDLNWMRSSLVFRLLPDELYDPMLERFKNIRGEEPFQSYIPTGMRDAPHDYPELVGTLDKAYEVRDISDKMSVEKFLRRIMKELEIRELRLAIGLKFDGSSLSATLQVTGDDMVPIRATSRGDFEDNKGVDMTNLVKDRHSIPAISEWGTGLVGIQYEAMMTEKGRIKLSEITGIKYSTRRAAIAAAIKRVVTESNSPKDREKINECISLVPINIDESTLKDGDMPWIDAIQQLGTDGYYGEIPLTQTIIYGDLETLLNSIQELVAHHSQMRAQLPYSIDGLVISVIYEPIRKKLGRSNNRNRWQIAYKFNAMVQRTKVTGILTTQGRQGFMGHNITFDPIEFNGVVYDKAPVNNITRFNGLNLRLGDEVLVSYNADVMGYIYKDESCIPNKDGKKIKLPEKCIYCEEPLIVRKDMLKCENEECTGQQAGRIMEVIRILDLDFFGEETAQALVRVGITNAIEFLQMRKSDLEMVLVGKNLEKAWDQFREKIKAEIDYAKVIDLLRIPGLRTKTAKKIIDYMEMGWLNRLISEASERGDIRYLASALQDVPGVDKNAQVFATGLVEKVDEFRKLIDLLNVTEVKAKKYDKIVLVSGFRSNPEFERICQTLNYGITDGGKYDILVVTPDRISGTKAKAALKSGKPMYTLLEFISKYKQ